MLSSVLLVILVTPCTCLSLRQTEQASKADGHDDFKKIAEAGLDVVVPLREPNCVVEKSIKQINLHIAPRRILVVTDPAHCQEVEQFADNVKCLGEDQVLFNTTKASVAQRIDTLRSQNVSGTTPGYGGHSVAGWYLQQFIKLGIADSPLLRGKDALSQVYMVIDSDLIPFSNLYLHDDQNRMPLMQGGEKHGTFKSKNVEAKNWCPYEYAYSKLTGEHMLNAETHGYVSHHMVFHQTYLKEMLTSFGDDWMDSVLRVACGPDRSQLNCACGFSEYASYGSWMKRFHADRIYDVPESFARHHDKHHCCPTEDVEKSAIDQGLKAIVFEQSHC